MSEDGEDTFDGEAFVVVKGCIESLLERLMLAIHFNSLLPLVQGHGVKIGLEQSVLVTRVQTDKVARKEKDFS